MTRANYTRRPDKRKHERDVQQAVERYRLHRNRFEIAEVHVGEDMLDEANIHEQFERYELTAIVKQIFVGMDAKLSEVLLRHEFQDESLEHIAKALGIARNTVQSRLVEAKRIFRLLSCKVLGDNRNATPLLLRFGAETYLHSRAFIEVMRKQMWKRIAHELALDEMLEVKSHGSNKGSSLRKRTFWRIFDSEIHMGVGPTAEFIAALCWPRELPTTAKDVSMVTPARWEMMLDAFKCVSASTDRARHC